MPTCERAGAPRGEDASRSALTCGAWWPTIAASAWTELDARLDAPGGDRPPPASSEDFLHDLARHIGQAKIAAAKAEGQPRVVDAELVKHSGVQVVDVNAGPCQ